MSDVVSEVRCVLNDVYAEIKEYQPCNWVSEARERIVSLINKLERAIDGSIEVYGNYSRDVAHLLRILTEFIHNEVDAIFSETHMLCINDNANFVERVKKYIDEIEKKLLKGGE